MLEFCKHLLDRVEVWTLGRQEQDPGTDGADRLAGRCSLVASQVVEDDDVAGRERGNEELLDIGRERLAVDRAIEHERGIDPVVPESCKEGLCPPATKRGLADQLLSPGRPAPDRGHVGLHPGFIDEDEAPWIKPTLVLAPLLPASRDLWPVLLDGEEAFFTAETGRPHHRPDRVVADHDAALGQFGRQSPHRQIGAFGQATQKPVLLAQQHALPVAAHLAVSCCPRRFHPQLPFHDAGHAHTEQLGRLACRPAFDHRSRYPLPEVI